MKHFEIFTKNGCPFCDKAKTLLKSKGYTYEEHVIGVNSSPAQAQARVDQLGVGVQVKTVPQIILKEESGDRYIGGYNELNQQSNSGLV